MTSLGLDALTTVGGELSIEKNDKLPDCLADALDAQVTSGASQVKDNLDGCTCAVPDGGGALVATCP